MREHFLRHGRKRGQVQRLHGVRGKKGGGGGPFPSRAKKKKRGEEEPQLQHFEVILNNEKGKKKERNPSLGPSGEGLKGGGGKKMSYLSPFAPQGGGGKKGEPSMPVFLLRKEKTFISAQGDNKGKRVSSSWADMATEGGEEAFTCSREGSC